MPTGGDPLPVAERLFQAHCTTAGEKIYKTVDDVEGIFLMKVRPEGTNYNDQFAMDDPYGRDLGGDGYISTFVKGSHPRPKEPAAGAPQRLGYLYVEAIDPQDGKRYRYSGDIKEVVHTQSILIGGDGKTQFTTNDFVLDRVLATGPMPRYAVTYDDISTREDRNYWIAGSSLKVIDLQTNSVIAERIGYMVDLGQGDTGGGRSPWLMAANHACPTFQRNPLSPIPPGRGASAQSHQTEDFVEKVLKPAANIR